MKGLERTDKQLNVVVLTSHEVTAAKINPLQAREPRGELIYNMFERTREGISTTLAMAMDMETFYCCGESVWRRKVLGQNAKTGTWSTGIIELSFYLAVLWIYAQTKRNGNSSISIPRFHHRQEAAKLREAVEGDMGRVGENDGEIVLRVCRAIGVCGRAEFLEGETRLIRR